MKKILIVVDYQNDFIDGVLSVPDAERIRKFIQNKIDSDEYEKIIYTLDTHNKDDYSGSAEEELFPIHCEFGTNGWKLGIVPRSGEIDDNKYFDIIETLDETEVFFTKDKFNIFEGNDMYEDYLKKFKDYAFEMVGVATNYCVYTHSIGLVQRGYDVTVIDKGVKGILDDTYEDRVKEMKEKGVKWKF